MASSSTTLIVSNSGRAFKYQLTLILAENSQCSFVVSESKIFFSFPDNDYGGNNHDENHSGNNDDGVVVV